MSHSHNHGADHSHDHDHDHSHVPEVDAGNEKKVLLSFCLIFTFMVVEMVGGVLSGSLALLSDAGHMLTDAMALALAYMAFRLGRRAADAQRSFGYQRFEVVAGLFNALTLFAIVIWILYEAWQRLSAPAEVLAGPMMAVAVVGLLVNILVLWILTRGDSEHVNIKGALLHVMGDLLGSVGAIGAAIIIYLTGWTPIDPILSVLVSLLILRSAWGLARQTLNILLEGAPANVTPEQIERHLKETLPQMAAVEHIHVWSLTSGKTLASLHVRAKDPADDKDLVLAVEEALIRQFGISHPTVALSWAGREITCAFSLKPSSAAHNHSHAH